MALREVRRNVSKSGRSPSVRGGVGGGVGLGVAVGVSSSGAVVEVSVRSATDVADDPGVSEGEPRRLELGGTAGAAAGSWVAVGVVTRAAADVFGDGEEAVGVGVLPSTAVVLAGWGVSDARLLGARSLSGADVDIKGVATPCGTAAVAARASVDGKISQGVAVGDGVLVGQGVRGSRVGRSKASSAPSVALAEGLLEVWRVDAASGMTTRASSSKSATRKTNPAPARASTFSFACLAFRATTLLRSAQRYA
jgi:hypothetical protein